MSCTNVILFDVSVCRMVRYYLTSDSFLFFSQFLDCAVVIPFLIEGLLIGCQLGFSKKINCN